MDTPSEPLHAHMRPPLAALGSVTVDGARVRASDLPPLLQCGERSYSAEIWARQVDEQSRLIAQVIGFALDTLGARHLDVRVHPADA